MTREWELRRRGEVERREDHGEMRLKQFVKIRISLLLLYSIVGFGIAMLGDINAILSGP
jgi:hypothetical protein